MEAFYKSESFFNEIVNSLSIKYLIDNIRTSEFIASEKVKSSSSSSFLIGEYIKFIFKLINRFPSNLEIFTLLQQVFTDKNINYFCNFSDSVNTDKKKAEDYLSTFILYNIVKIYRKAPSKFGDFLNEFV